MNFVHVDTGAMYRTLAWYCLKQRVDVQDAKAVAATCRRFCPRVHQVADADGLCADWLTEADTG